jgi:hypothetical protein
MKLAEGLLLALSGRTRESEHAHERSPPPLMTQNGPWSQTGQFGEEPDCSVYNLQAFGSLASG